MTSLRSMTVASMLAILLMFSPAGFSQKKKLTPDVAYQTPPLQLTKALPNVSGWESDDVYTEMKKKEGEKEARAHLIRAKSGRDEGEKEPPVQWSEYKALAGDKFDLSKPLVSDRKNQRHLYASDNDLYLLDVSKKEFRRLTNSPGEEKNPTISPDGSMAAYTRDNDLYVADLATGKETRLTSDGSDVVYSGYAAWVYYEEILGRGSRYKAYWWSPDSRRIAFFRFDESGVPMFPIYRSTGQHGSLERTRYPEVGDPNPTVRIGMADLKGGTTVWADVNDREDQYFGTPFWNPNGKELWIQWMNRKQNDLKVFAVDAATGAKREAYHEQQSSWVEWLDDVHFLKDGKSFIIKSDRDGWMHLYHYGMDGALLRQITSGKWQVSGIELVSDKEIWFTARKEASTRTDLYRIGIDGSGLKRLTFGPFTHSVKLSPNGSYFVTTYSNVSTPPKMALCDRDGRVVRELGNSWQKDLDEYELAATSLIEIPTSDGIKLPALITLPPSIDPGKRYPVLISIYGGPNAGTVFDGWRLSMQTQGLAADGLVQVSVDHRGSGHFGKEGVALMYHNLGKWEMNDYIEAVKWLRAQPYVDSTRVCITGGSYGGYVTCLALTYGAGYFTHGLANFSVTDWTLYDSHYTERFMGTPADNPDGYKFGSVLTHASNYKGLLRIVHGTTDDNVHFQNSLQLIDTLENLGRHFEFMAYPNERHGWGPPKSDHLRMETLRFYYKNLLLKEMPDLAALARKPKP